MQREVLEGLMKPKSPKVLETSVQEILKDRSSGKPRSDRRGLKTVSNSVTRATARSKCQDFQVHKTTQNLRLKSFSNHKSLQKRPSSQINIEEVYSEHIGSPEQPTSPRATRLISCRVPVAALRGFWAQLPSGGAMRLQSVTMLQLLLFSFCSASYNIHQSLFSD